MATVGSVYSVPSNPRTPDDVMRSCTKEDKRLPPPRIANKRVWDSVERTPDQVTNELFQELLHRDSKQKWERVVLVDGDER